MNDRDDAVPTADAAPQADPSRNATTHGLTARRPLCEREAERLRILVDHWTSKHRPETEAEEALVQMAAVEYVRYLRCVQADEAQKGPNARKALREWQERRRHAIRRKAQDLREDPAGVAAELQESAFGIDWMLGHWRRLLGQIDAGTGWSGDDLTTAMHLIGRQPRKPAEDDIDGRRLWDTVWQASPAALDVKAQRGIADAEAAGELRALVADRIARLEAMRPLAWEEEEGPMAEAVESAAMLDTSKEGQLRNRYRREAFGDVHRGLGMLNRLKVERSKMDDRLARQERLGAKARPSSADDRPAWVAPSSSNRAPIPPDGTDRPGPDATSASATASGASPQRNEPAETPPAEREIRHNPNGYRDLSTGSPADTPADRRRTGPHPEAHRGGSGGADPGRPGPGTARGDGLKAG